MDFFNRWPIFYWWSLISRVLAFIFNKITYAWLAMAEREGGRERGREGERLRITSLKKTSSGKSFKVFFLDFVTFFLWNVFLTKIIPDERISRPKSLPNKHVFRRHIFMLKKTFKNDIPLGNSSNDCKNLYRN